MNKIDKRQRHEQRNTNMTEETIRKGEYKISWTGTNLGKHQLLNLKIKKNKKNSGMQG